MLFVVSEGTCLYYDLDEYRKIRLGHEPYGQSLELLFFLEAENM